MARVAGHPRSSPQSAQRKDSRQAAQLRRRRVDEAESSPGVHHQHRYGEAVQAGHERRDQVVGPGDEPPEVGTHAVRIPSGRHPAGQHVLGQILEVERQRLQVPGDERRDQQGQEQDRGRRDDQDQHEGPRERAVDPAVDLRLLDLDDDGPAGPAHGHRREGREHRPAAIPLHLRCAGLPDEGRPDGGRRHAVVLRRPPERGHHAVPDRVQHRIGAQPQVLADQIALLGLPHAVAPPHDAVDGVDGNL